MIVTGITREALRANVGNTEIMKAVISTGLHIEYKDGGATHKGITDFAVAIKKALHPLYPLTDKQWNEVLRDIAHYADCLI